MKAEKIRIGIAGSRGLVYLPGFLDMPGVEVTALCELDNTLLEVQAEKHSIPLKFRVFDDLCDCDQVDAVFIATPMQLHIPQTLTALSAGKHVLCEVIACTSMEELFWLKEAAEQSNRVYMMC